MQFGRGTCVPCGLLALGLAGYASAQEPALAPSRWGRDGADVLAGVVPRDLVAGQLPGAVVAAGDAQGVRFSLACGSLQLAPQPVPMPADAIFDLASVTKVVGTTTAVMLLVDEGRLGLDDPLANHLPEWRERPAGEDLRVRHLLTHTSGLPAYLTVALLEKEHGPGPQPDVVIAAIAKLPLRRAPDSGVEYSCLNAILAGRIAENVAGTSLHAFLTERVFLPLGMRDTGWQLTRAQRARLVPTGKTGCLGADGALPGDLPAGPCSAGLVHDPLAHYYATATRCAGNAGLFSTAADLGRFARLILGRGELDGLRLLRAETVERFTRVQTPPGMDTRGYGWDVWNSAPFQPAADRPAERLAVGHLGFTGTMIWLDKDSDLWAVVLASRVHGGPDASVVALRRDVIQAVAEGASAAPAP
jgi:CubicO group peptidase (beta-lactamase class C family)